MVTPPVGNSETFHVNDGVLYIALTWGDRDGVAYTIYNLSGEVVDEGAFTEVGGGGFWHLQKNMVELTDEVYFIKLEYKGDSSTQFISGGVIFNNVPLEDVYDVDVIKQLRFGNQKIDFTFATETNTTRKVEVGMLDYQTIMIKSDEDKDWVEPVSTKELYFWYDSNAKLISVKEEDS